MTRFTNLVGAVALATGAWLGQGAATQAQDTADQAEIDTSTIVEMVLGDENAPVEVIEYASYTCVHCANFHEGPYKKLKAEYIDTGKVKFIYREVYFDRYGLWASMIARCAGPDRFFGVNDLIYASQSDWMSAGDPGAIVEELRKIGRLSGLDNDTIEACLQDRDKAQTLISWYQENVEQHDIQGTPSFIVNGKKVSNMSWQDFKAILDEELAS